MYSRLRDLTWPLLYPLACLWGALALVRRNACGKTKRFEPDRKTLTVGNLHSGGSGKTPIVEAIARNFASLSPVIISRGYLGALSAQGAIVDAENPQGPAAYGDEPWMLLRRLAIPVFIGKNRAVAMRSAQSQTQGGLFLLDDAFQNFSFRHDVDLVCIHTGRSPEDSFCLPLGDLREPVSSLRFASAVILVEGCHLAEWKNFLSQAFPSLPCFETRPKVEGVWGEQGPVALGGNLHWGAFCGIARPEGFRLSLKEIAPVFFESFADHHVYTQENVDALLAEKTRQDVHHLITTEKDWYKAAPLFAQKGSALFYLRIGYVFSDEFWYFLRTRLETA